MKDKGNGENLLFKMIHDYLLVYLPKQRCSSPNTIESCKTAINFMLDFMAAKNDVPLKDVSFEHISSESVMALLDYLTEERHISASTRNQRLACIRGFMKYAAARNPELVSIMIDLASIPIQRAEANKLIEYLSMDAMQCLLEQPDTSRDKGVRDQFFMTLMYDTAARIQEMLDLRICDISTGRTPTAKLTGKGAKKRTVPLMDKTMEHFRYYMKLFHPNEKPESTKPLFYVRRKGSIEKISADAVRRFLDKYAVMAHEICAEVPPHIHPHIFRHSRAMHLYQNGMALELVSQWLGHASLQATLIYAHADTEQKRKAIEKANGNLLISKLKTPNNSTDNDQALRKMCGLC